MRGPCPDADDRLQFGDCGLDVAARAQIDFALRNCTGERHERSCPRRRHAESSNLRGLGCGDKASRGKEKRRAVRRSINGCPELTYQPSEERARRTYSDLLADNRACGKLEAVERTRNAQARMR